MGCTQHGAGDNREWVILRWAEKIEYREVRVTMLSRCRTPPYTLHVDPNNITTYLRHLRPPNAVLEDSHESQNPVKEPRRCHRDDPKLVSPLQLGAEKQHDEAPASRDDEDGEEDVKSSYCPFWT